MCLKIKNRKNKTIIRNIHTTYYPENKTLNPWFITGLTDGEGCFTCVVREHKNFRLGWKVDIVFQIALHKKDFNLLKCIQSYFGGMGMIYSSSKDMCSYKISSLNQILKTVITHFDKYNLLTQKQADYLLWKKNNNFNGGKKTFN